jgi:hypothetical protein
MAATAGGAAVLTVVVGASTTTDYTNGVATAPAARPVNTLANALALRIGGLTTGSYADMEFVAAAVFRRALSAAEITTISDFLKGRAN